MYSYVKKYNGSRGHRKTKNKNKKEKDTDTVRRIAFCISIFFDHFKTRVMKENEEKMTEINQKRSNNHKTVKLVQDIPK